MPHDSEMGAGSDSARETMRVSNLIKTSKFLSSRIRQPPVLYLDSESNIKSNKSRELTKRSKHLDISFHFMRDLHKRGALPTEWISRDDNTADMMTHELGKVELSNHLKKCGIVERSKLPFRV